MISFFLNVDHGLFSLINQTLAWAPLDGVFVFITHKYFYLGVSALGAVALPLRFRKAGLACVAAAALAVAFSDLSVARALKPLFHRVRPPFALESVRLLLPHQPPSPSFPSSHAANAAAFAFAVMLHYRRTGTAFMAVAFVVAYSRVYVGVHYPLDALSGIVWGIACGVIANGVVLIARERWARWRYLRRAKRPSPAPH